MGYGIHLKRRPFRPICVFPALFRPASFINYPSYTKWRGMSPTAENLAANHNAYQRPNVYFEDKIIRRTEKGEVLKYFDIFSSITKPNVAEITSTAILQGRRAVLCRLRCCWFRISVSNASILHLI